MTVDTQLIDLRNIHSLTDFRRRSAELVQDMKESGRPLVLTVNGKAEVVAVAAEQFQKLLELADWAENVQGLRRALEQSERGEGRPVEEFLSELRGEHGEDIPG